MKRILAIVLLALLILCVFSGCEKTYSEDEIVGLTSIEIVEKYGVFDRTQGFPDEDGFYRDCACGYLISEKQVGFFGTIPPEYFMIYFDEDGVAHWCRYEEIV